MPLTTMGWGITAAGPEDTTTLGWTGNTWGPTLYPLIVLSKLPKAVKITAIIMMKGKRTKNHANQLAPPRHNTFKVQVQKMTKINLIKKNKIICKGLHLPAQ
jgi:hypothetical protein